MLRKIVVLLYLWLKEKAIGQPIAFSSWVFVIFVHLALLFYFPREKVSLFVQRPHRVTVQTVHLRPEKKRVSQVKPSKRKKKVQKKKSSSKKKEVAKSEKKKVVDDEEADLLKQLKKSLSSWEEEDSDNDFVSSAESEKIAVPEKLRNLRGEYSTLSRLDSLEESYVEGMVDHLKKMLLFPEYGRVKVRLVVNQQGGVVSMEVISSENKKNENYLKKMLPKIVFPGFSSFIKGEGEKSFILTLGNEL